MVIPIRSLAHFFNFQASERETVLQINIDHFVLEHQNKDTLLSIRRAQILPRTRVMSDMRRSNACLEDEGYAHLTVNHSLNFVDPDTGAHSALYIVGSETKLASCKGGRLAHMAQSDWSRAWPYMVMCADFCCFRPDGWLVL